MSAIHQAAGPQLVQACRKVPEVKPGVRCPTGEARITPLVPSLIHFSSFGLLSSYKYICLPLH
jgi:O-acetyl-ADP-ribose deacetylase (regulator of RNase III)